MKTFSQFTNEIMVYKDIEETIGAEEKISIAKMGKILKKERLLDNYLSAIKKISNDACFSYSYSKPPVLVGKQVFPILLVFGGEKGMVGDLWSRLAFSANQAIKQKRYGEINVYGSKMKEKIDGGKNILPFPDDKYISEMSDKIFFEFVSGNISGLDIIFPSADNENISSIMIKKERIIPLSEGGKVPSQPKNDNSWMIVEPNNKRASLIILSKIIKTNVLKAYFSAQFSELVSRAINMEKAGEETRKIIKKLKRMFFSRRKRVLTKNQIEVFVAHKTIKSYGN